MVLSKVYQKAVTVMEYRRYSSLFQSIFGIFEQEEYRRYSDMVTAYRYTFDNTIIMCAKTVLCIKFQYSNCKTIGTKILTTMH